MAAANSTSFGVAHQAAESAGSGFSMTPWTRQAGARSEATQSEVSWPRAKVRWVAKSGPGGAWRRRRGFRRSPSPV